MSGLSWFVMGVFWLVSFFWIIIVFGSLGGTPLRTEAKKRKRDIKQKIKELEKLEAATRELEQNNSTAQATNEALQRRLQELKQEKSKIQQHYRTIKQAHRLLMLLEYVGAEDTEDMTRIVLKKMRNGENTEIR